MNYELNDRGIMIEIDRTQIMDISVGDTLSTKQLPDFKYQWQQQDSQFLESNPDGKIFLKVRHNDAAEIVVFPAS